MRQLKLWHILTGISLLGLGIISSFQLRSQPSVGTAVPQSPALFDTYLASGISNTDTSMTLAAGTLRSGQSLSGFMCFNVDNNQPTVEFICGTASGTAVTGLMRGVDVFNPNTTSSALAYNHRRLASVSISDYPTLQFLVRKANGTDSFDTVLKYTSSSVTNSIIGLDPGNIPSVAFVASTSYNGTVDATTLIKGIIQLGTAAQLAASTALGSTGATIVAGGSLYSATSSASILIPTTKTNGKLSQTFFDLTESFAFSGLLSSSATTTFTGTTVLATTTVSGTDVGSQLSKFGGTGADGALTLSGGATSSIALGSAAVVVKNYTSISLTGTSSLSFSSPATNGSIIILKSQGACTLTSASSTMIDLRNLGTAGGAAGSGVDNNVGGLGGGGGGGASMLTSGSTGGGGSTGGASGGTAGAASVFGNGLLFATGGALGGSGGGSTYAATGDGTGGVRGATTYSIFSKAISLSVGTGGGGGGGAGDDSINGGAGGRGAGALYIECGTALNFTGTINAAGTAGSSAATSTGGSGGGGGGGSVMMLYRSLTANSGTITVTGGANGAIGTGNGDGADGYSLVATSTEY